MSGSTGGNFQSNNIYSKSKQRLKNAFIFTSTLCIGTISATYLYILYKEYITGLEFIKNKYQKYINDPSYVYIKCQGSCIAVLQRFMDAKFCESKFLIIDIICLQNPNKKINSAYANAYFNNYNYEYKIGMYVLPLKSYNSSDHTVFTNHCHFFKSFDVAFHSCNYMNKYSGYMMNYEENDKPRIPLIYYFDGKKYYLNSHGGKKGYIAFWRKALIVYGQILDLNIILGNMI